MSVEVKLSTTTLRIKTMGKYSPEIAAEICERLANGESLRSVCRSDHMPTEAAVRQWAMDDYNGFASHYARAREIGYERMAEEILSISDEGINDTYLDDDGVERTNHDVIARSKLRVDSRKWLLSKMLPKKYGDKLQTEVSGGLALQVVSGVTEPGGDLV